MIERDPIQCDLAVLGAGMAGMAAALFAVNRGLTVVQTGVSGEMALSSGLFDLMGVHPISEGKQWQNPWRAINALRSDEPKHPYAEIPDYIILKAFEELQTFLTEEGRLYHFDKDANVPVCTALGTIKESWMIPKSMLEGSQACKQKKKCLITGFKGVKGFSAIQIAQSLKSRWAGISTAEVVVPGTENNQDVFPEQIARILDNEEVHEQLVRQIRPQLGDAQAVGFPAAMGFYNTDRVVWRLSEMLGVPVFEIPTMPPSVPGLRLKETFENGLAKKDHYSLIRKKIDHYTTDDNGEFWLHTDDTASGSETIQARAVILATGRFTGKGLHAGRKKITEPLFDIPVTQPECRSHWLNTDFLVSEGHPINRAGIETDRYLRPEDTNGHPMYDNLFAAGSILAHQDWKRMKCGTGLAVATSYAAVESLLTLRSL